MKSQITNINMLTFLASLYVLVALVCNLVGGHIPYSTEISKLHNIWLISIGAVIGCSLLHSLLTEGLAGFLSSGGSSRNADEDRSPEPRREEATKPVANTWTKPDRYQVQYFRQSRWFPGTAPVSVDSVAINQMDAVRARNPLAEHVRVVQINPEGKIVGTVVSG
jgi:hypothetical protein